MSKIGNFGKQIVFSVSSKKVLTFSDLNETISGRWSEHSVQYRRPQAEFLGPSSMQITMTIVVDAGLGVSPIKMRSKIKSCIDNGSTEYLVIGGRKLSSNKFYVSQMSDTWDVIYKNGKVSKMTMNLTFVEYAR